MKQVRFTLPNNSECPDADLQHREHDSERPVVDSQSQKDSKRPRLDLLKTQERVRYQDLSPIVYISSGKVQSALPQRAFIVLLDSGSTHTMVKRTSLPHGTIPSRGARRKTTTTNGTYSSSEFVIINEVKFPEFGNR